MADETDLNDWAPGQPPPWLSAFGPPPNAPVQQTQIPEGPLVGPIVSTLPPIVPPEPPPPPKKDEPKKFDRPGFLGEELPGPPSSDPTAQPLAPPTGPTPNPLGALLGGVQGAGQSGLAAFGLAPPPNETPEQAHQRLLAQLGGVTTEQTQGASPGETPDQALVRTAMNPNAPLQERQKAFAGLSTEQRAAAVNTADPTQLAAIATATMAPEDLATIAVRHQQAMIHEQSAQQLELMRKRDEQAAQDWQAHQAAIQHSNNVLAQVEANAKQLAAHPLSGGRAIRALIAGTLGGAMSQYTGGKNLGLEGVTAHIDNEWKGLNVQREVAGEQLKNANDLYRDQVTYRVSQYDRATAELQTQMQDYDPQGTTALRAAGVVQQIQAARQQTLQTLGQQEFKNGLDASKAYLEVQNAQRAQEAQAETMRHNRTDEGLRGYELSLKAQEQKQKSAENVQWQPQQLAQLHPGLPVPPIPMSEKEYSQWIETGTKGQEFAAKQTASAIRDSSGNPLTYAKGDNKGKPVTLPSDKAPEVNEIVTSTQSVIDDLGAVREALSKDPSTIDRVTWAKIINRANSAIPRLAKVYGEKYSARTEDALKDVLGLDYDKIRNRIFNKETGIAAINTQLEELDQEGTRELKGKTGYDGTAKIFSGVEQPPQPPESQTSKDLRVIEGGVDPGAFGEDYKKSLAENRDAISSLGRTMQDSKADPKTRYQAYQSLITTALHGGNDDVKNAAWAIVQALPGDYREQLRLAAEGSK